MPTLKEMQELITKCKIKVFDDGTLCIIKTDDVYSNFINIKVPHGTEDYGIWTGSIAPDDNDKAYALIIDVKNKNVHLESKDRECGYAILPVTELPFKKYEL